MPNWCFCDIMITGNMEKISKMLSKDEDGCSIFLQNLVSYEGEWDYEWCWNNWGTKWDVGSNNLEVNNNMLCGYCDFAWSPPIKCFKTYCEENDDVFIKMCYIEPNMVYLGYWDSVGNTIQDDYNSSNHKKYCENYKKYCDIDVNEYFNFDYFENWLEDQECYFDSSDEEDRSDEEDSSDEEEDSSEEELTCQFINEIACY